MTHYVLIDNCSGYVWEEADASDPVEACKIVDAKLGDYNRTYERERIGGSNIGGYHVYEAPNGWVEVEDGQSQAEIERVEAQCTKVAEVVFRAGDT